MRRLDLKRLLLIFTVIFCCTSLVTGCKKEKQDETFPETTEKETTQEAITEETTEAETEEVIPEGMCKSYLTGELVDEAIGRRRPIAAMYSNVAAANPQSGINNAGVVIEAPAEGGVVRLMGIIEDYDNLERIGSIRSARTYFVFLQAEFNPIFVHYGQCNYALEHMAKDYCDNLNGVLGIGNTVFYRSTDRKAPHNAYATPEGIWAGAEKMGYSLEYDEGYEGHFRFADDKNKTDMSEGTSANLVYPGYSNNKPWFEYNKNDGLYYRYQFGSKHIDDLDGRQVACKNIILEFCEYEHYYDTEYLYIYVTGSGAGKYITDGKAIDITWKKDSEAGITHYYDMNGDEILLNTGKTWICVIQTERLDKVEIYE